MNASTEPVVESKASVVLKLYTRRVFSKIKSPEKTKQKSVLSRKNRSG
jgi:hypothetical protein